MAKRPQRPRPRIEPGALYSFRRGDGRYGALQVIDPGDEPLGDSVLVAELEGAWKKPPTMKQAAGASIVMRDYGFGRGPEPQWVFVRAAVPWWATPLGVAPSVPSYDARFTAVGDEWPSEQEGPAETLEITRSGDYRRTKAKYAHVKVSGAMEIRVPETLRGLHVEGDHGKLSVDDVHVEYPFALSLSGPRVTALPSGFNALEKLSIDAKLIDCRALAPLTKLRALSINAMSGKLVNAKALAGLRGLREFIGRDVFDLDVTNFPDRHDWPELDVVYLRWLARSDAETLKRKLAGVPSMRMLFTRTAAQIAEATDNPFRDWGDENPSLGRAATKLWKELRGTRRRGAEVLKDFLRELNSLDAKYDLETHHLEQAAEATIELGKRVGVSRARALALFDELREF